MSKHLRVSIVVSYHSTDDDKLIIHILNLLIMVVSHSGSNIDATKQPKEAALLAANASAGAGSKRNAWDWCHTAYDCLLLISEDTAANFREITAKSDTNFPNAEAGIKYIESL